MEITNLVRHEIPGESGHYYTAQVTVTASGGVVATREYHNRYGSWLTDRKLGDKWPERSMMQEAPRDVAVALCMRVNADRRDRGESVPAYHYRLSD